MRLALAPRMSRWSVQRPCQLLSHLPREIINRFRVNGLAQIKSCIGELSRVTRVVRLEGFVQSAEGFQQQSVVMNGASDFIAEIFGEAGRHTRTAIGVSELPLNAACQISVFVEVSD